MTPFRILGLIIALQVRVRRQRGTLRGGIFFLCRALLAADTFRRTLTFPSLEVSEDQLDTFSVNRTLPQSPSRSCGAFATWLSSDREATAIQTANLKHSVEWHFAAASSCQSPEPDYPNLRTSYEVTVRGATSNPR